MTFINGFLLLAFISISIFIIILSTYIKRGRILWKTFEKNEWQICICHVKNIQIFWKKIFIIMIFREWKYDIHSFNDNNLWTLWSNVSKKIVIFIGEIFPGNYFMKLIFVNTQMRKKTIMLIEREKKDVFSKKQILNLIINQ